MVPAGARAAAVTVVDASALLLALRDPRGRQASAVEEAGELAAPSLLDLEIAQRLRFDVQDGRLSGGDGERLLLRLGQLPIERHDHVLLLPRIWQLRENVSAYDAAYVALAERMGATLLTADGRLSRAPGLRCPFQVVA